MLQILMTSAIQKSMSAKNTSNKSSEKLLDFAVNFLNFFLKNIVNNEKQFAQNQGDSHKLKNIVLDSDISEREDESEISLTLQNTIEKEKESIKSSLCSE